MQPPHFCSTLFGGSSQEVRKEQGIEIRKEELKLSLFSDDTISLIKNPTESTAMWLELINLPSEEAGYKISIQVSVVCELLEKEVSSFTVAPK